MTTKRAEWMRLTSELPIDPAIPICDAHHHLWDRPRDRYLLDEFRQDLGSGHNIVATVFIECKAMYRQDGPVEMRPTGETEFVQGIAAQRPSEPYGQTSVAAGIVSHADLTLGPAVARVLEAHLAASPDRLRGIRHACAWDVSPSVETANPCPPSLMAEPQFRAGLRCLRAYKLSFELWVYHPQLSEAAALARAVPEVLMIVNHVGGPLGVGPYTGKRDEVYQHWKHGIEELATCPNVVVKLGGLGMRRCGFEWHAQPLPPTSNELARVMAPYYLFCIERFGPDRCMFESNFPVDKASYAYGTLWNAFKRMTEHFSHGEREALFYKTASRVYRLRNCVADKR